MIVIAPSEIDANTFYIFRDNGVEFKVELKENQIFSDLTLTRNERAYLKRNLLYKEVSNTLESIIIKMHLQGNTDKYISEKLNIFKMFVERTTRQYWSNKKIG